MRPRSAMRRIGRCSSARHDPLHHADDMLEYWRPRLPGARFETIADAGRFLHLSHPQSVIEALRA